LGMADLNRGVISLSSIKPACGDITLLWLMVGG
jgi:hypothetical protein